MLNELRIKRDFLGISQSAMAKEVGCSQPHLWRIEANEVQVSLVRLSEMASVLGLELSVGLHEIGDPIRDKGHQALGKRFDAIPSLAWRNLAEVLLPNVGDRRSWDRVLTLLADPRQVVGVDLETRIRDIQALVRRTRDRERDGGVDEILIVLSGSATNRSLVADLRSALGSRYSTAPRGILADLRTARPIRGSGVMLI